MIFRRANQDPTSGRRKLQRAKHDTQLGRKLREKTVRSGEAWLRKEQNKELTSKRVLIDQNHLPKTHPLAIDLGTPITSNSPPIPAYHLQYCFKQNRDVNWIFKSTSATDSSGHTAASSTGSFSHARSSTSGRPSGNASCEHVHNQMQLTESLVLAIPKEQNELPLRDTMGRPVCRGEDFTIFMIVNECLLPHPWNNPLAGEEIAIVPYYGSGIMPEMIIMTHRYPSNNWEQLNQKVKDALCPSNCQVNMYTRLNQEWHGQYQLEHVKVSMKVSILTHNNICHTRINKGAFLKYWQVDMLLGAHLWDLRPNMVIAL